MPRKILLVCGGNTCRSPMAEAIMRKVIESEFPQMAGEIVVESAGVAAVEGDTASENALTAAAKIGLDLSDHRARALTAKLISEADIILAMEGKHIASILAMDPSAAGRVHTLADADIADPFGSSLEIYERTRDDIEAAVRRSLDVINRGGAG